MRQREATLKEENELLLEEAEFRKTQVEELQQERLKLEETIKSLQCEIQRQSKEIATLTDTVETQRVLLNANAKDNEQFNNLLQETNTVTSSSYTSPSLTLICRCSLLRMFFLLSDWNRSDP